MAKKMKRSDLIGLMVAYGFEPQYEKPEQYLTRFQGEGTFIDIWNGRKGITMGVYDSVRKYMRFYKKCSLENIEDILYRLRGQTVEGGC